MKVLGIAIVLVWIASAARADVVILEQNDMPLTGRILSETKDAIVFQLRGLGDVSRFSIERSRIKRYWREENTYWEYQKSEREYAAMLERLRNAKPEPKEPPEAAAETAPPEPAPPRGRSGVEIREALALKALDRVKGIIPGSPIARLGLVLLGVVALSGLIYLGSRVADLPGLGLGKAAVLAVVAAGFSFVFVLAPPETLRPGSFPLVIVGQIAIWLVLARVLAGGTFSKAVLLFSFLVATLFLTGSSIFSVLSAL